MLAPIYCEAKTRFWQECHRLLTISISIVNHVTQAVFQTLWIHLQWKKEAKILMSTGWAAEKSFAAWQKLRKKRWLWTELCSKVLIQGNESSEMTTLAHKPRQNNKRRSFKHDAKIVFRHCPGNIRGHPMRGAKIQHDADLNEKEPGFFFSNLFFLREWWIYLQLLTASEQSWQKSSGTQLLLHRNSNRTITNSSLPVDALYSLPVLHRFWCKPSQMMDVILHQASFRI